MFQAAVKLSIGYQRNVSILQVVCRIDGPIPDIVTT